MKFSFHLFNNAVCLLLGAFMTSVPSTLLQPVVKVFVPCIQL